jgi:hypothetical protein
MIGGTMKSKKLIELLQKEDPSGEGEVCVMTEDGNVDIFHLEWKEGYWDGPYQVLKRDWSSEYYNVIGAHYRNDGAKLCLRPLSIEDALLDDEELPVEITDIAVEKRLADQVGSWREEMRKIKEKVEDPFFLQVMKKIKEGNRVLQRKEDKIGHFHVMHWNQIKFEKYGGKKYPLNQGECGVIINSGFFKPVEKEDCIEWVFTL